jgi:hypothetical protein
MATMNAVRLWKAPSLALGAENALITERRYRINAM